MRIDHVRVAAPPGCLDALAARIGDVEWDDAAPGVRRFYATDPFGNRLEFLQGP